jgi:putative component of membrane protein insertase Oxa1/YidC/SpoIIIJ protein YidD
LLKRRFLTICWYLAAVVLVFSPAQPVRAGSADEAVQQAAWSSPLTLFQRVISRADGDRCPMAPSCSQYASTAFQHHHPVTAWILTCDRLLRCGHDEVRQAPRAWVGGRGRAYDPVSANTFWWRKP